MEVAHPIVRVEDLTVSSLKDAEVHLTQELESGVGNVLGISLSEVCARYFQDSDIGSDLAEEWNLGDVIENHAQSGRYETEDINGVPYAAYDSDA
jgi:hypothetical protein